MLYAVLCYNDEQAVGDWSAAQEAETMDRLIQVQTALAGKNKLGPVARLQNTDQARTLRKTAGAPLVVDGPFAETKEQFLGFYVIDCDSIDGATDVARELADANPGTGSYEIRPLRTFLPWNSIKGADEALAPAP